MKVIKNNSIPFDVCSELKSSVTLGTFDGVHIAHRQILRKLIKEADKRGNEAVVVTFDRHPSAVLQPEYSPKKLTTLEEKLEIFDKTGVNLTYVIHFTKQIAEMSAEKFIRDYLIDYLGMNHLIVGYDHGFGKKREGSIQTLSKLSKKINFTLDIQEPIIYNGMVVKSSNIRAQLEEGNVEFASELLGKDYSFIGEVLRGQGIGKKIGVPTANIAVKDIEKIVPTSGVYAGWIEFDCHKREIVVSIGPKPTFNKYEEYIEAHILDFNKDLYGKEIRIGFNRRLRNIIKFDTRQALVNQIKKDIENLKQNIPI